MYKDTKINRYELFEGIVDESKLAEDFDVIDGFKDKIAQYIYTDIPMTDHTEGLSKALQSRLQILLSSVLLRSIRLRDGAVRELNEANFPAYYAALKSLMEVPALLGYVVELLNSGASDEEIIPKINQLSLGGGREEGVMLPKSDVQPLNVLTLLDKVGVVLRKMHGAGTSQTTPEELAQMDSIPRKFYSDVCDFAHINYPAHLSIGILHKDNVWRAKQNNENYKKELYYYYMPHLVTTLVLTELMSSRIAAHGKVNGFDLMTSPKLF